MPPVPRTGSARVALALAAVLALLAAAPGAASTPPRDPTAAAVRQATIDLRLAAVDQIPTINASLGRLEAPICKKAIRGVPDKQADALLDSYLVPLIAEMQVVPLQRAFNQHIVELEAIPIADPALRSGRAAWRVIARFFGALVPPPADVCGPLDAWRRAGYSAASRPTVSDPGVAALMRADAQFELVDRKLERSGRRLRVLGVSKRVVGWWTLDTLLEGVDV